MEAQPIPILNLPTRRTFVMLLVFMLATVLFFTADWWLGVRMLQQHYLLVGRVLHIVMWAALASCAFKWARGRDSWWILFGGGSLVIGAVFLPLVSNVGETRRIFRVAAGVGISTVSSWRWHCVDRLVRRGNPAKT